MKVMFILCSFFIISLCKHVLSKSIEHNCPDNEYWSSCLLGECRAMKCNEVGISIPCPGIAPPCPEGCVCKEGFVRIKENDKCIPEEQCPGKCGGDENAEEKGCVSLCQPTCDDPIPGICNATCILNGCECVRGFILDKPGGKCIADKECEGK